MDELEAELSQLKQQRLVALKKIFQEIKTVEETVINCVQTHMNALRAHFQDEEEVFNRRAVTMDFAVQDLKESLTSFDNVRLILEGDTVGVMETIPVVANEESPSKTH